MVKLKATSAEKRDGMPPKIRELRSRLRKAGFFLSRTRGSHTVWSHPALPDTVVIAGNDGKDAKSYQIHDVENALRALEELEGRK